MANAGDFDAFVRNSDKMLEDMREIKEMLRDLLEPPIFSGKDPEQWLQSIEAYFGFNRTPSNRRFSIVEKCLAISGKHWFSLLSEICPYLTWSKFKEFFMERFGPSETKVNKEVETAIVEVMSSDSGSDSKVAEDGGDGKKKTIDDVDSGSSIVPTSDSQQEEVSRTVLIVEEEDRLIQQQEEDEKLLLSPAAVMFLDQEDGDLGQPKQICVDMGQAYFSKQAHFSKQLMEHFWPKTVTWVPFYVDTGQEDQPILEVNQFQLGSTLQFLSDFFFLSTASQIGYVLFGEWSPPFMPTREDHRLEQLETTENIIPIITSTNQPPSVFRSRKQTKVQIGEPDVKHKIQNSTQSFLFDVSPRSEDRQTVMVDQITTIELPAQARTIAAVIGVVRLPPHSLLVTATTTKSCGGVVQNQFFATTTAVIISTSTPTFYDTGQTHHTHTSIGFKLEVFCLSNCGDCLTLVRWVSIRKEVVKWLGRLSCAQLNDGNIAIALCKSFLVYYDGMRTSFGCYPLVLFSHFVQLVVHGFVVCIDKHISKSVLVKMNRSLPLEGLRNLFVQHSIGAPWILIARLNVGVQPKTWEFGLVGSINTRKKIMFPVIKRCGGFQLLASYFKESMCIRICDSMLLRVRAETQHKISKFLLDLVEFEDDDRAESMVTEWKEFLWDVPEERVALWGHCQTLFIRYALPPLQAGLFFLKHAEMVEKDLPARELHELLLHSLPRLSGMITLSNPVYPINLLREIETRVWLLAVESETQAKSDGDLTSTASSRDLVIGNSSNKIDKTASIVVASRESVSIRYDNCDSKISVSLPLTTLQLTFNG